MQHPRKARGIPGKRRMKRKLRLRGYHYGRFENCSGYSGGRIGEHDSGRSRATACRSSFLALGSDRTFYQDTLLRVPPKSAGGTDPIIITADAFRFLCPPTGRRKSASTVTIILEPGAARFSGGSDRRRPAMPRRSMAMIASCWRSPADHLVPDVGPLPAGMPGPAAAAAEEGHIVTFGITPNRAAHQLWAISSRAKPLGHPGRLRRHLLRREAGPRGRRNAMSARRLSLEFRAISSSRPALMAVGGRQISSRRSSPAPKKTIAGAIEDIGFIRPGREELRGQCRRSRSTMPCSSAPDRGPPSSRVASAGPTSAVGNAVPRQPARPAEHGNVHLPAPSR